MAVDSQHVEILGRVTDPRDDQGQPTQQPLSWRSVAALIVLLAAFLGLRSLHGLQPEPVAAPMPTGTVVVVGVTDRSSLTGRDRALIDSHSNAVQFAAVSLRPRYIGDCTAAGWTGSATRGLNGSGLPTGHSASPQLPRITETQCSERWQRPCTVASQR